MLDLHDWTQPFHHLAFEEALNVLDAGSHKPLLCLLKDGDGTSPWVVKTRSMYGGLSTPLLRELLGADVFSAVGLPPPRAALLRVPSPGDVTGETDAAREARVLFKKDEGSLAFCSAYIDAPTLPAVMNGRLAKWLRRDLVLLFATDVLLWHGDRTRENPNVLLLDKALVPIDHDRVLWTVDQIDAAGFLPAIDGPAPTRIIEDHVARSISLAEKSQAAWNTVEARFKTLEEQLPTLLARWPEDLDRGFSGLLAGFRTLASGFLLSQGKRRLDVIAEARRG